MAHAQIPPWKKRGADLPVHAEAEQVLLQRLVADSEEGLTAEDIIVNVRAEVARWPERQSPEERAAEEAALVDEIATAVGEEQGEAAAAAVRRAHADMAARRSKEGKP